MSFNKEYAKHSEHPFGGMTRDILNLLDKMKTEKFICLQTLSTNEDLIYILRGKVNEEDDFEFGSENVMEVKPHHIVDKTVLKATGKNHAQLANAVDKSVIEAIRTFSQDCEVLPLDKKQGLSPCVRAAGIAISSKLMRLTRLAIVGNKKIISNAYSSISKNLPALACNIKDVIVFNAGTMTFDGGIFFIPLSLDKRSGQLELEYLVVTDNSALNFIKLMEEAEEKEEIIYHSSLTNDNNDLSNTK